MSRPRKRKSVSAECDILFSKLVRASGFCIRCRSTQNLQCAHGFSRRYRNTRWDFENAWCLCKGCHMYYTHHPIEWDDWMQSVLGRRYYELRARALSTEKPDMDVILATLRSAA